MVKMLREFISEELWYTFYACHRNNWFNRRLCTSYNVHICNLVSGIRFWYLVIGGGGLRSPNWSAITILLHFIPPPGPYSTKMILVLSGYNFNFHILQTLPVRWQCPFSARLIPKENLNFSFAGASFTKIAFTKPPFLRTLGNSEHDARRKRGLFWNKKYPTRDCSQSNQMPKQVN